jgi:hypothetical protein
VSKMSHIASRPIRGKKQSARRFADGTPRWKTFGRVTWTYSDAFDGHGVLKREHDLGHVFQDIGADLELDEGYGTRR